MYENTMKRLNMYHGLELSELETETGRTKNARQSLGKTKEKYEM